MKKITASILAVCILLLTAAFTSASSEQSNMQKGELQELAKDETVYVNLAFDGSIDEINVVNRLETPKDGIYIDPGIYSKVVNLTNAREPVIEEGKVKWQLSADPKGFYYQGTLSEGELPYTLQLTYTLDGKETQPDAMLGKSGRAGIKINVKANQKAAAYFKDNYMLQIQIPVSLDTSSNIDAPGASMVIVGRTATLAYMVLPGSDSEFSLSYDTSDFGLDSFSITSSYIDLKSIIGLDLDTEAIKSDVKKMSEGTGSLVEGTSELKAGLSQLKDGIDKMAQGGRQIDARIPEIETGAKAYLGGVSELSESASQISSNLEQLAAKGMELTAGFSQLKAGLEQFITQMSASPLLPSETKTQLAMLQGQLDAYESGLSEYTNGTAMLSAGMKGFADGISQLSSSNEEMIGGISMMLGGISELTDGLSKTSNELKDLPDEVQKLIDGQTELKNGIDQSMGLFEDLKIPANTAAQPVSFVSQDVRARSVQFVMKTPELKAAKEEKEIIKDNDDKKGFFEKLRDLFR